MLLAVGIVLLATGLPAFAVLMGVAAVFAAVGVVAGAVEYPLLTALPSRIIGLLENDLLQALPLYVFMGSLLNRLPLADRLFRCGVALSELGGGKSGGAPALATLGLGALLAPMNGSVGASVAMLSRSVAPKLAARGVPAAESTALVCVASTLGVVIPPSLVLILLGDAMMRAHTEATNVTKEMVRIVNTQDIFRGALVPAVMFLVLCLIVAWWLGRRRPARQEVERPLASEWATAVIAAVFVICLLGGVAAGYFYAVEAAAMGGTALLLFGLLSGGLRAGVFAAVLRDTMAVSGALFALFVAATTFTLVFRTFGTDRLLYDWVAAVPAGPTGAAIAVLVVFALSAFVLDAFEIVLRDRADRHAAGADARARRGLDLGAGAACPAGELPGAADRLCGDDGAERSRPEGADPPARPGAGALSRRTACRAGAGAAAAAARPSRPAKGADAPPVEKVDDETARKRFNDMLKLPPPPDE